MKKLFTLFLLTFFLVLALPVSNAFAQTDKAASLSISPAIFDLNMNPGEKSKELLKIQNNSDDAVTIKIEMSDFTYNEKGEMKYEDNPGVASLKKWMSTSEQELTMAPGEQKDIIFDINVPVNGEPGAHYGVIFFSNKPKEGSSIGISARVGSLVLVTLPGKTTKSGTVSDFMVGSKNTTNRIDSHSFFTTEPVDFSFVVKNTGNVHFKPQGAITITDMFGNVVKEVSPMDSRAFPGANRTYIQSADIKPWGMYKATLNLKDGDGNQMESLTVSFWGFNYQLVIQWLIIAVVLFFVLRFGIKRYNAWIIKQAKAKK